MLTKAQAVDALIEVNHDVDDIAVKLPENPSNAARKHYARRMRATAEMLTAVADALEDGT
jgi:hypothetical protein